jgi:hypothetical protein
MFIAATGEAPLMSEARILHKEVGIIVESILGIIVESNFVGIIVESIFATGALHPYPRKGPSVIKDVMTCDEILGCKNDKGIDDAESLQRAASGAQCHRGNLVLQWLQPGR